MIEVSESPNGYTEYVEYIVPERRIVLLVLALTIGLGETFFSGVIVWFYNTVSQSFTNFVIVSLEELFFIGGMILVHESIHYLVARKQGYNPQAGIRFFDGFFGIKEPSPYIVVLNEHIPRNHNLAMLITPLLVIDAVALVGFLPIFPAYIAFFAKITLVVNTASSIQDVYSVFRLLKMDEETQFINIMEDDVRSFYCQPQD